MNVVDTLRAMVRRWYIVVPGMVLAGVLSAFVFMHGNVVYERSASMVLVPGSASVPKNDNPFLYISGLGDTADVLVRAVGAPSVLDEVHQQYPDAQVTVARDPATPGPILVITVKSPVDADAGRALGDMIGRSDALLTSLQDAEHIPPADQVTATHLTLDTKGTVSQKTRLLTTVGVGVVLLALTILAAALVDVLAGRRRSARNRGVDAGRPGQAAVTPMPAPTHARPSASRVAGR